MKNTFNKVVRRCQIMEQTNAKGDKPDFKGNLDVAGWINEDKNGNKYLSIVIGNRANLFRHIMAESETTELEFEDIFE